MEPKKMHTKESREIDTNKLQARKVASAQDIKQMTKLQCYASRHQLSLSG
jgi:hypothetical protein